jgi:hypothetical protein
MRHQTLYFTCGVCGLQVGTVENDIEDAEQDTEMPPGWIEVTARRVVKNPDFVEPKTLDQHIDELVAEIAASQGAPPEGVDPRAAVRPHAELQFAIEQQSVEPKFIVEEVQFHVSPDYTTTLTALDEEAFGEMGWELPKAEAKSEVA